jgi:phosphate starvation-inducible protein PhoH
MSKKQNKFSIYRRDVYDALSKLDGEIIVQDVMKLIDWPENKETNMHNVRESLRDIEAMGLITSERRGQRVYINKTTCFADHMVPNPWVEQPEN